MFEVVGECYWLMYFEMFKWCLWFGKNVMLQIIMVIDKCWEVYCKGVDFIQKYIFLGGMLFSFIVLCQQVECVGLDVKWLIEFGESYSIMLCCWYDMFNDKWDQVVSMGFDDCFCWMWNFYFVFCVVIFYS